MSGPSNPSAKEVKDRLNDAIVGANVDEKRAVMQEIKKHKPFCFDHDIDSSIALHLCRSLTEIAAHQSDAPLPLTVNLVHTIVNVIPSCKMLNELLPDSDVSLYDKVVPLMAAALLRVDDMDQVKKLLIKYLLNTEISRVLVAMDIWCIFFRASEVLQRPESEFLFNFALQFPEQSFRRRNIHMLLSRFMRFMDEEVVHYLISKFDPCKNGFHFALKYLSQERKQSELIKLVDQVFGSASCVLKDVLSISHLLTLVPNPDEHLVIKMKMLVAHIRDEGAGDQTAKNVTDECMALLSAI